MSSPLVRRCIDRLCERLDDLAPGERLPGEARLAEDLSVSRSPLRVALAHLEERGLVAREGRFHVLRRAVRAGDRSKEPAEPLSQAEAFDTWFLTAIAERRLRPGEGFTEVEVAAEAGVTPATVREVLGRYAARRLVAKDPRRSWRMIRFDDAAIAELWELRRMIEHHALERLFADEAARASAGLEGLLAEHRALRGTAKDLPRFRDLDRRFHRALAAACPNRFIADLRAMIDLLIHVQLADDDVGRDGMGHGIAQHTAILEAILSGDRKTARTVLDQHLASSEAIMRRAAARDGDP